MDAGLAVVKEIPVYLVNFNDFIYTAHYVNKAK